MGRHKAGEGDERQARYGLGQALLAAMQDKGIRFRAGILSLMLYALRRAAGAHSSVALCPPACYILGHAIMHDR